VRLDGFALNCSKGLVVLALAGALQACGGGGSGSSTANADLPAQGGTPAPSNPSNPAASPSPGNGAPTITGAPASEATTGQGYSFTPSARDPEGAALTFSITGKPSWAAFDASTGRLSGTAAAGTYANIVISVSDGTSSASLPPFTLDVASGAAVSGSATVQWLPPTTLTDGAAFTNPAGYRIYYGPDATAFTSVVTLENAGLTSFTIDDLPSGTYFFAVTALDSAGNESLLSNVATKTI
jgi:hypothetical protein